MFKKGQLYRRVSLHEEYGGRRQSGISNCPKNPIIFIFSGKTGKQHGYQDGWDEDNYFWYSGEGQIGDMKFTGGNKSVLNHQVDEKKIYLFEKSKKSGWWMFIDELQLVNYEYYNTGDTEGNERKGIKFKLLSISKELSIEDKIVTPLPKRKYNHNRPNRTQRRGLVNSRVGQGYYRQQILDKWNNRCGVTGSNLEKILISSHIVPWKDSNDFEKLDPENGILLSPTLDGLFDKYLISFEDTGKIIISNKIDKEDIYCLGINQNMKLTQITDGMKPYLSRHRKIFNDKN